ncbi:cell division protein FtsX [Fidelibacter multiformis]|jgi:cell division transport system permease protein|uniref:cell division protein FtsX n=1 Tax=Fidelibacter multiformis TaxID=3377529 RepID=UPI0037DDD8C8
MRLSFILKQTFINLWTARLPALVAVFTIGISLSIVIGMGLLGYKAFTSFDLFQDKFEIEVFLYPNLNRNEITRIQNELADIHQIKMINYISKDEAARIFKEEFGEDIHDILDENPLPPSFHIKLYKQMTHPDIVENVAKRISDLQGVDDVKYHKEILILMEKYFRLITLVGTGVILALIIAMNILIRNTIKLSVYARRKQISILQQLGAGGLFIRLPYILEGILEGALGGAFAGLLLHLSFQVINFSVQYIFDISLAFSPLIWTVSIITGALMGMFSSSRAAKSFMYLFARDDY